MGRDIVRAVLSACVGAFIGISGTAYVYSTTIDRRLVIVETQLHDVLQWQARKDQAADELRLNRLETQNGGNRHL